MLFDADKMNERNYYRFDEGYQTYLIIYPMWFYDVEMITEEQFQTIKELSDNDLETSIFKESLMQSYVTCELADKMIKRLQKREHIVMAFSKQAEQDSGRAYDEFKRIVNSII